MNSQKYKFAGRWFLGILGWLLLGTTYFWYSIIERADHEFRKKSRTKAPKLQIETLSLSEVKRTREDLYGHRIALTGRVFCDEGKWFWMVSDGEQDPLSSYAIKLSAWPFQEDPKPGMVTREFRLVGNFEEGETFDVLIGPFIIEQWPGSDPNGTGLN